MSDELKSDHYRNKRDSIYKKIRWALPYRIRVSWIGRKYWAWLHEDTARLSHCPPHNECAFCQRYQEQPRLDRLRYWLERKL